MASKRTESKGDEPKRINRAVALSEALGSTLGPALKKRGFASRDIVTHWASIAPSPYDKFAAPDSLKWPRGERGAEGAVLYLRCADSHKLALAHEGAAVAGAINRYFGYLLVGDVRLSPAPFTAGSAQKAEGRPAPDKAAVAKVEQHLAGVDDQGLREALRRLGIGLISRR